MSKPHVILVFGEPDAGKSWIALNLYENHGYYTVSADDEYIEFVREFYPKLHLESLNLVVSQHYRMVLKATEKGVDKAWGQHMTNLISRYLATGFTRLVFEGYLLAPILKTLRRKLSKVARVSVVYVKDRRYYLDSTIEQIQKSKV